MSTILYYSNYCNNCKPLLQKLGQSNIKNDMHFVCIDKRAKKPNGSTNIILENGEEILLPPNITKVPALMLLNRGNRVLFGEEITEYIKPQEIEVNNTATMNNGDPHAFSIIDNTTSGYGVMSDNYSFLDQEPEELSAQGNGGMRQMHNFVSLGHKDNIETPPDTYEPDKVGTIDLNKIQEQRNRDIQQKQ
mgnify:CR=1 FL=1